MSVLLLDAGNTRLKWALVDQDRWLSHGTVNYDALRQGQAPLPSATRIRACNVAGPDIATLLQAAAPIDIEWLGATAMQAGVTNGYRSAQQLGADRWAALIAVRGLTQQDAIVVMAGTALTVDALRADGQFVGGVIVPGFSLMRAALARGTADLGLPDGDVVDFPQATGEAIVNGALVALAGAVQVQHQRLSALSGRRPEIWLSGGDASTLQPVLTALLGDTVHSVDNLVLRGLHRLALLDRET